MSDGIGGGIIALREGWWFIMLIRAAPPPPSLSAAGSAIMRCSHISPGSASHRWLYCLVAGRRRLPYMPAVVG